MSDVHEQKIRQRVRRKAQIFGLKYSVDMFSHMYISKQQAVLRNFLAGSRDPRYTKFGRSKKARAQHIGQFMRSAAYKLDSSKIRGSVISLKELKREQKLLEQMKNKKAVSLLSSLYRKVETELSGNNIIIIAKPHTKADKKRFPEVYTHLLVVQLLLANNIYFSDIKRSYWRWDSGLCTYISRYPKFNFLWAERPGPKRFWHIYVEYAIKWYDILYNKKTPVARKRCIIRQFKVIQT